MTSRTDCAGHSRFGWDDPSFQALPQLEPSILASFLVLAILAICTILAITYLSGDNIAHRNEAELQQRFHTYVPANIEREFNPLKSLVRLKH